MSPQTVFPPPALWSRHYGRVTKTRGPGIWWLLLFTVARVYPLWASVSSFTDILHFITLWRCRGFVCLFVYKWKVCGRPVSSKSTGTILPTAFAHCVSLCHVLVTHSISNFLIFIVISVVARCDQWSWLAASLDDGLAFFFFSKNSLTKVCGVFRHSTVVQLVDGGIV